MLSERRDEDAATAFFKQAINNNGFPDKVVMDKSGANYAGLANINLIMSLGKCVPLKLIMILFYAHWEIRGELSQNLPINATEPRFHPLPPFEYGITGHLYSSLLIIVIHPLI
jgi:transposase-like protein